MERRTFVGELTEIVSEASQWLECQPSFLYESYNDGDFDRPRYFERLNSKHATLILSGGPDEVD